MEKVLATRDCIFRKRSSGKCSCYSVATTFPLPKGHSFPTAWRLQLTRTCSKGPSGKCNHYSVAISQQERETHTHTHTHTQGQKSAQGILRLRNPNLGPNSVKRILDARILDPNSWVEFFDSVFVQQKRPPEKFTLEKFTSQNSPSKIQPRNRAKKFTLHLCRAIWLTHTHRAQIKVFPWGIQSLHCIPVHVFLFGFCSREGDPRHPPKNHPPK